MSSHLFLQFHNQQVTSIVKSNDAPAVGFSHYPLQSFAKPWLPISIAKNLQTLQQSAIFSSHIDKRKTMFTDTSKTNEPPKLVVSRKSTEDLIPATILPQLQIPLLEDEDEDNLDLSNKEDPFAVRLAPRPEQPPNSPTRSDFMMPEDHIPRNPVSVQKSKGLHTYPVVIRRSRDGKPELRLASLAITEDSIGSVDSFDCHGSRNSLDIVASKGGYLNSNRNSSGKVVRKFSPIHLGDFQSDFPTVPSLNASAERLNTSVTPHKSNTQL